jgi:hypothetical protein
MKKNILFLIFLISCTIFSLLFYFLNRQIELDNNRHKWEESEKELRFIEMNEELNKKLANNFIQNVICEDIEANQCFLASLVSPNPKLIYRYSEINCNDCFESDLALLQEFFSDEKQKIVILCSYQNRKYLVEFKKMNRIELPIYRILKDTFNWKLEKYGESYYFVLHPDMKVSHIFVPNKDFPELNKQYLESVKRFLSE